MGSFSDYVFLKRCRITAECAPPLSPVPDFLKPAKSIMALAGSPHFHHAAFTRHCQVCCLHSDPDVVPCHGQMCGTIPSLSLSDCSLTYTPNIYSSLFSPCARVCSLRRFSLAGELQGCNKTSALKLKFSCALELLNTCMGAGALQALPLFRH